MFDGLPAGALPVLLGEVMGPGQKLYKPGFCHTGSISCVKQITLRPIAWAGCGKMGGYEAAYRRRSLFPDPS
jgi:hypothetical protein